MNRFLLSTKQPVNQDGWVKQTYWMYGLCEFHNMWCGFDGKLWNESEILEKTGTSVIEEALLVGWKKWGDELVMQLRGSFSFLLVDEEQIYFAKDHLGTRPLFYGEAGGFFCGNDVTLLLSYGLCDAIVNRDGLTQLFALSPAMEEHQTLYRDVKMLAMGEYGTYHHCVNTNVYYELTAKAHHENLEESVKHVEELVKDAVATQLPYVKGSLLSGGLDSSILCALSKQQNFPTFSLEYEGNADHFESNNFQVSLDDAYIKQMVDRYHFDHHPLLIHQEELASLVKDACIARGFPGMADVDASMLWLFHRLKEKGIDAIFSGECSDEAFCGYPWMYQEALQCDTFPWNRYGEYRMRLIHPSLKDLPIASYLKQKYEETIQKVKVLPTDRKEDIKARQQTMLVTHWFMQTLITRQVTMSQAAGIEVFTPFADERIFDYAYNLPWDMKFLDGAEKGILRKAFEMILPKDIAHRKKNPYPKTHHPKYQELAKAMLREAYEEKESALHVLFDNHALLELIESGGDSYQQPWYGQLMSGPQLLAYLYQIHVWAKHFQVKFEL